MKRGMGRGTGIPIPCKGGSLPFMAATRIDGTVNIYTEGLDPVNHLKYYRN
jgi:hypothetical protein